MALSQRTWLLGGVGAGALLVGLTYFVGVGPELSHNSSVKAQISAAQDQNTALVIKNRKLQRESTGLDALMAQQKQQQLVLPSETGVASFTRDIAAMAASNGLTLKTLTIAAPALTTASGIAPAATAVVSPVGSLYQIPISLNLEGQPGDELAFMHQLQTQESRAVLVSSVQLAAVQNGVSLTITLKVFLAPQAAVAAATLK